MTETHVVALCGSLRDDSHTRKALRIALDAAEELGATTELLDLREWDLPVFDPDDEDASDGEAFRREVQAADSILLGTPVYHGSYSAPLKNALDYCGFDEFEKKTVGLLCVAGGSFPITAPRPPPIGVSLAGLLGRSPPGRHSAREQRVPSDELTDDSVRRARHHARQRRLSSTPG